MQNTAMRNKTRAYSARVDIEAPAARVWRALTDNAALARWLSPRARCTARRGGSFTASLDRQHDFTAHIDVFEEARRLRLVHMPPIEVPPFDGAIVDDIVIATQGDKTILRVLGSGFPRDEPYGRFYMVRQIGWRRALARLKVFLEKNMDVKST